MGLASFNQMRIRQIEKMKPENIIKQQTKENEVTSKEEQPIIPKSKAKNNK